MCKERELNTKGVWAVGPGPLGTQINTWLLLLGADTPLQRNYTPEINGNKWPNGQGWRAGVWDTAGILDVGLCLGTCLVRLSDSITSLLKTLPWVCLWSPSGERKPNCFAGHKKRTLWDLTTAHPCSPICWPWGAPGPSTLMEPWSPGSLVPSGLCCLSAWMPSCALLLTCTPLPPLCLADSHMVPDCSNAHGVGDFLPKTTFHLSFSWSELGAALLVTYFLLLCHSFLKLHRQREERGGPHYPAWGSQTEDILSFCTN